MMMDENTIRDRIRDALNEPPVPSALVEQTAVRGKAIERGRAAEQKLAANGDALPGETRRELYAEAVIGRLMMTAKPPQGVGYETMLEQLQSDGRFSGIAAQPTEKLLNDLRTGKWIAALGDKRQDPHRAETPEALSAEPTGKKTQPESPLKEKGPQTPGL